MAGPFVIASADLRWTGAGLHRPECVLATASGRLWVSDWRGGVTAIHPRGNCEPLLASPPVAGLRPNGIAMRPDGSFLLACLGEYGGIWHLGRNGRCEPFCTRVEGRPMPPTNFVHE
ncbi:MAG: 5-valerolactone hydrolase, partial [Pseudomonadota bacterium]